MILESYKRKQLFLFLLAAMFNISELVKADVNIHEYETLPVLVSFDGSAAISKIWHKNNSEQQSTFNMRILNQETHNIEIEIEKNSSCLKPVYAHAECSFDIKYKGNKNKTNQSVIEAIISGGNNDQIREYIYVINIDKEILCDPASYVYIMSNNLMANDSNNTEQYFPAILEQLEHDEKSLDIIDTKQVSTQCDNFKEYGVIDTQECTVGNGKFAKRYKRYKGKEDVWYPSYKSGKLPPNSVDLLCSDKGTLYAAVNNALYCSLNKGTTWNECFNNASKITALYLFDDNLYIGTEEGYVYRTEVKENGDINDVWKKPRGLSREKTKITSFAAGNNYLFIGTNKGLYRTKLDADGSQGKEISTDNIISLCFSKSKNLFGTKTKLYVASSKNDNADTITIDVTNDNGDNWGDPKNTEYRKINEFNGKLSCMYSSKEDHLYIGTEDGDIYELDKDENQWKSITDFVKSSDEKIIAGKITAIKYYNDCLYAGVAGKNKGVYIKCKGINKVNEMDIEALKKVKEAKDEWGTVTKDIISMEIMDGDLYAGTNQNILRAVLAKNTGREPGIWKSIKNNKGVSAIITIGVVTEAATIWKYLNGASGDARYVPPPTTDNNDQPPFPGLFHDIRGRERGRDLYQLVKL